MCSKGTMARSIELSTTCKPARQHTHIYIRYLCQAVRVCVHACVHACVRVCVLCLCICMCVYTVHYNMHREIPASSQEEEASEGWSDYYRSSRRMALLQQPCKEENL